ncbi:MAG: hypothetical protein Q8M08_07675 [Bacteroidales bacterium]|nr:hypothetical protein [Bacteroidales bacterium]
MSFLCIFAQSIMKVLTLILSLYILVLIAIPCVDRPFESTIHPTEQTDHAGHNHENDADQCSPFCDCNCCGNQVVSAESIVLAEVISLPGHLVFWYSADFNSEPYRSIWLPPELI